MKYIVVGDLHIGVKKGSPRYYEVVDKLIDRVIQYAKQHNITKLIQCGDVFDNRKSLLLSTLNIANNLFDKLTQHFTEIQIVAGNHDIANKNSMFPNSLVIFDKFNNINVITESQVIEDDYCKMLFLPYLFDVSEMVEADICIGHLNINGAVMNSSNVAARNHYLNFSDFAKYKLTISGHYHAPGLYTNNIRYVGAPYQLTFNDIKSNRGFWVLDTSDISMTFQEFIEYPHHYQFTDKSENVTITDVEDNIIKLVFTEDYGIDKNRDIINRYMDMKPYSLIVRYSNFQNIECSEEVDEDSFNKSKLDILTEYYEKVELPESVDLELLKAVTGQVYEKYIEEG